MMRRQFDGSAILYWVLIGLVLFSYIAPLYVVVTQSLHTHIPTWILNPLALVTLIVTFKPIWHWVQPRIHHVVYAVDDPHVEIISHLNNVMTSMAPEQPMLTAIAETIAQTAKIPYTQIETANGTKATYGTLIRGGVRTRIEIAHSNVTVGWLEVTSRLPGEPLTINEYHLLHSLARQVGITLHVAQLTDALQASREQLVLGREEERRRIRRDLHDGLGPTLASLRLQLSALRRTVCQDAAAAEALIDELRGDVRTATAEIRRLVYDLRPPMLDEFGLVGALHNLDTSDSLIRSVEAPATLPPLPAAVEVAIYRIAAEALHNIIRHGHATRCTIRLAVDAAAVTLTVTDDGCGVPATYLAGIGHHSMHERAAELGGSVAILPAPAGGLAVTAIFPFKEAHDA